MIQGVLAGAALAGSAIAVYTDLRWRIIPNWLTYSLIGCGILVHLVWGGLNGDWWNAVSGALGAGFAFLLGYALWLTGGWAGGDVKLFTAYGALLPFYQPPGTYQLLYPFFITVLFNSLILAVPVIAVYALVRKILGKSVFYDIVRITELEEGMIPAELIYEKNGKIRRTRSWLGIKPRGVKIYADPNRAAGLSRTQVRVLKRLVRQRKLQNRLKLKRGMPFAPLLALGLLVGVFYGDLYWTIVFSFL